ncbi:MAG: hypothetical protein EXR72_12530 [Myxococcales bacterium]|nr:hypothetical protein [Myxococcales bacterium]
MRAPPSSSLLILLALQGGCAAKDAPVDAGVDLSLADLAPTNPLVALRPYKFKVPARFDPSRPAPLVVLLHGYGVTAELEDLYFGLNRIVDDRGFLYAWPDGSGDAKHNPFWNAGDDLVTDGGLVDDVAYVHAVIDDMSAHFSVDPKRIFVAGHSNGGFMAHRMACDRQGRIAAIASLAGSMWADPVLCAPPGPIAVLQIHGDADEQIPYGGGEILGRKYASAPGSAAGWAKRSGCGPTPEGTLPPLDLEGVLPAEETARERFTGCAPGGASELWTMHGGSHIPTLKSTFAPAIWDFFAAHPKP